MDKSKPVSILLSNAELKTIEKFQKKYKIKSMSDFFRISASFFISTTDNIVQLASSEELNSKLEKFNKEVKDELQKVTVTAFTLREKFEVVEDPIMTKLD